MPITHDRFHDTGANRGIGFELATRLLDKGHKVYGSYRPQSRKDSSTVEVRCPDLIFLV